MRWLMFFAIVFAAIGASMHHMAKQPKQAARDDEFRRRQIESQQATHTEYME